MLLLHLGPTTERNEWRSETVINEQLPQRGSAGILFADLANQRTREGRAFLHVYTSGLDSYTSDLFSFQSNLLKSAALTKHVLLVRAAMTASGRSELSTMVPSTYVVPPVIQAIDPDTHRLIQIRNDLLLSVKRITAS